MKQFPHKNWKRNEYLLRKQNFAVKGNSKIESSEVVKKSWEEKDVDYDAKKVLFPFIDNQILIESSTV